MSKENNEKTKLIDIEDGDKLAQLIELLPLILELDIHKKRLFDVTPPTGSTNSAKLDE